MGIVIVILSFIIASKICKVINQNTIGTTTAYVVRVMVVWAIVIAILSVVADNIGLI